MWLEKGGGGKDGVRMEEQGRRTSPPPPQVYRRLTAMEDTWVLDQRETKRARLDVGANDGPSQPQTATVGSAVLAPFVGISIFYSDNEVGADGRKLSNLKFIDDLTVALGGAFGHDTVQILRTCTHGAQERDCNCFRVPDVTVTRTVPSGLRIHLVPASSPNAMAVYMRCLVGGFLMVYVGTGLRLYNNFTYNVALGGGESVPEAVDIVRRCIPPVRTAINNAAPWLIL